MYMLPSRWKKYAPQFFLCYALFVYQCILWLRYDEFFVIFMCIQKIYFRKPSFTFALFMRSVDFSNSNYLQLQHSNCILHAFRRPNPIPHCVRLPYVHGRLNEVDSIWFLYEFLKKSRRLEAVTTSLLSSIWYGEIKQWEIENPQCFSYEILDTIFISLA